MRRTGLSCIDTMIVIRNNYTWINTVWHLESLLKIPVNRGLHYAGPDPRFMDGNVDNYAVKYCRKVCPRGYTEAKIRTRWSVEPVYTTIQYNTLCKLGGHARL